ncbi:MAG: sulfurtransferase-like selenium metabolism protein YedF [Desulfuromonadales bacterium]
MDTIDCRNMPCPAPVISVKKALEHSGEIRVLLDDGAPHENVTRFARNRGFTLQEEQSDNGWAVTITSGTPDNPTLPASPSGKPVFLVSSDRLGDGPEELGRLLMKNFIHTLLEAGDLPARMLFLNSGVRLTTEGSDVLEALDKLAGMGVEILSCGLCLDFFGIKDKLRAGSTTNMLAIVETILATDRIVRL